MDFFDIGSRYGWPEKYNDVFPHYVQALRKQLELAIPGEVSHIEGVPTKKKLKQAYARLTEILPLIHLTPVDKGSQHCSVFVLVTGHYTWGVGRFIADIVNRWLIPGKTLLLYGVQGLNFYFNHHPEQVFYAHSLSIRLTDPNDGEIIRDVFEKFAAEVKTIIEATSYTRRLIRTSTLPMEYKEAFFQDYLNSLMREDKEFDQSVYDHIHRTLLYAQGERNTAEIEKYVTRLDSRKTHVLDRDIFTEIQNYMMVFRERFMSKRTQFHLYRIISYKYFFRKWLTHRLRESDGKRHMAIKSILLTVNERSALGIIVGTNSIHENEIFEARHILGAVRAYFPRARLVEDSYIVDARMGSSISTHYLEVEKENGEKFSTDEVKTLREKLPRELPTRIESAAHSLFIRRNEEEVMRNILILSRQLKYVKDPPQVMVNFDRQTPTSLCFTVIALRLKRQETLPLKLLLQQANSSHKVYNLDIKYAGKLRKKYLKEANIFEVHMNKQSFLRLDSSIDIYKARHSVVSFLMDLFGDVRDYNGGMISKQDEALTELKALVKTQGIINDFLLENFFYSISPTPMQNLLPAHILSKLFISLLNHIEKDYRETPYRIETLVQDDYCFTAIVAPKAGYLNQLSSSIEAAGVSETELASARLNIYNLMATGYIYQFNAVSKNQEFANTLEAVMENWGHVH